MRKLLALGLFVFGFYYITQGSIGIFNDFKNGNAALALGGVSEEELFTTLREHYGATLQKTLEALNESNVDTIVSDLNDDGKSDIIASVDSSDTCGTGGCITSIFLQNELGELTAIPFAYAVKHIEVLSSVTRGMHDLRINDDETSRMIWDGVTYVAERVENKL